jgi:hypothetical protein
MNRPSVLRRPVNMDTRTDGSDECVCVWYVCVSAYGVCCVCVVCVCVCVCVCVTDEVLVAGADPGAA